MRGGRKDQDEEENKREKYNIRRRKRMTSRSGRTRGYPLDEMFRVCDDRRAGKRGSAGINDRRENNLHC